MTAITHFKKFVPFQTVDIRPATCTCKRTRNLFFFSTVIKITDFLIKILDMLSNLIEVMTCIRVLIYNIIV